MLRQGTFISYKDIMKKLCAIICALALVGCSSKQEKVTTVCEGTSNGLPTKLTFESEGDNLLKQTQETTTDLNGLPLSEEEIIEVAEAVKSDYNFEGVTYTYKLENNTLYETFTFDYSKENLPTLQEKGLVTSENDKEVTFVSLEMTLNTYKEEGFTCE